MDSCALKMGAQLRKVETMCFGLNRSNVRLRLALLLLVLVSLVPTSPSFASGDRVALVIGNAKYPDSEAPLKEPINDARAVADELKRDGFAVDVGENLTGEGMRRAFDELYGKIKPGSVVLVFFGGFGIQSNRQSYLIPVDAQIWTEADVRRDGLSLETVLGEINTRGAGVKIALIDASRRNPFERRFRSFSAGLAPVIAPNGTLVMYSAALSSVIPEGGGDRGMFVQELLKEIRTPDLMAEETLNRTRVGVTRTSHGDQVPWISSSLADDFSFNPASGAPRPSTQSQSAPVKPQVEASPVPSPSLPPVPARPQVEASPVPSPSPPPVPVKPQVQASAPPSSSLPPANNASDIHTNSNDGVATELSLADDPTIKDLSVRITVNPNDVTALYRRGQVYAGKGAYALAIRDFDATLRINPRDVEALNNRCWTRTVAGELQGAMKDCNEALRLRPDFVDALDSRGLLNLKLGATANAIADFSAALKLNPRLTSSLYGRGLAKQRGGQISEGALDVASAKALDPNIVQEFANYGVR